MNHTRFAAVIIAAGLITTPVLALDSKPPAQPAPKDGYFQKIDTNADGVVSKEEWLARGEQKFAEMDANRDGKLSKEEMKAHRDAMRTKREARRAEKEKLRQQQAKTPPAAEKKAAPAGQ